MLSVQLSIIKLVFRNPCVVKARFCPLDTLTIIKRSTILFFPSNGKHPPVTEISVCRAGISVIGLEIFPASPVTDPFLFFFIKNYFPINFQTNLASKSILILTVNRLISPSFDRKACVFDFSSGNRALVTRSRFDRQTEISETGPARPPSHMNTSKIVQSKKGVRQDLGTRASPVNRGHTKST